MYGDKICDKVFENLEYEKIRIQRIENQIKAKPTQKDLKTAIQVLVDFGIIIKISEIPELNSIFELEKWKSKKIKERLSLED